MGALEEVRDLATAVAQRRSLKLWDVEMVGREGRALLRVFVDSDEGVDLDTIAAVSEEISRGLDLHDPIAGKFTLEVSSPGLERTLRSKEHFEASVGRQVVMKTTERFVADSHRLEGVVKAADDDHVRLEAEGSQIDIPYDSIRMARTVFEWK